MKSDIVVLYYRQPYKEVFKGGKVVFEANDRPNGILSVLKNFFASESNGAWIATSEFAGRENVPDREEIEILETGGTCVLRRVPLSGEESRKFYYESCKEGFWPILHSFPEKFNCDSIDWAVFESINERFAIEACSEVSDDGIVWIHDYNLWLAPFYIRRIMPRVRIAYFFHTTFPPPDIFNMLPFREQIVRSLLHCDLISFDIPRYVENFVATARGLLNVEITKKANVEDYFTSHGLALSEPEVTKEISYNGRSIHLEAFPEGTNFNYIKGLLVKPSVVRHAEAISESMKGRKLVFAASRLDYIKGTLELLECYERLLDRRPEMKKNIVLFVVSVHSGGIDAYTSTREEIERQVKRINDRFAKDDWSPVLYSGASLSFEEMIAWFSACDIMWVPSLRDGMNIVCKEFIVTRHNKGGVLILSEFAGAAVELPEAVFTNPYSSICMDNAVDVALSISPDEQRQRMNKLVDRVMSFDILDWSRQLDILRGRRELMVREPEDIML
jgi:glucosylglycerol-phosphate synthase